MKFVKLENYNVLITDDADETVELIPGGNVYSLTATALNDVVIIKKLDGSIIPVAVASVTATKINPAAEVPFVGTDANDLINLLGSSFFFVTGVRGLVGTVSNVNKTFVPLGIGGNYTGPAEDCSAFPAFAVACKTDQPGTLYVDFSPDGTNWDSTLSYEVQATVNEVHRLTVTRQYYRVRFDNTSGNVQGYLRLTVILGNQSQLTSPLNSVVQQDADSNVVRPVDFNLMVSWGRYQNHREITKDGINPDIDAGSAPEDIWNVGGLYTGFVTTTETATFVSTSASDTGTVFFSYLESPTSTDYLFGSIVLNGLTPVTTAFNVWRCNYMVYDNGSTFNVGTISMYQTTTTANIFCTIPAAHGQSFCSAFSVPLGMTAFIDYFSGGIKGGATATLDGFLYWRKPGQSPQLRYSYTLNSGSNNFDEVDYLFKIPELVDIIPRIQSTNGANNVSTQVRYRIILVKN